MVGGWAGFAVSFGVPVIACFGLVSFAFECSRDVNILVLL